VSFGKKEWGEVKVAIESKRFEKKKKLAFSKSRGPPSFDIQ